MMTSWRGAPIRRLRLATGLVLLAYLTTHFVNHALGLVSLSAMENGRGWFLALWRNPLGAVALYGSLVTHAALALWSLYRRRTLRMPAWEALQLVLGLAIPPLLASHIVGTRLANAWFDVTDSYTRVVLSLWVLRPEAGVRQGVLLLYLTAVGDTVHVASRLQDLTKEYGCQLVISEQVAARAGLDVSGHPRHELAVRNRAEPVAIRVIADVRRLTAVV